MHIFFDNLPHFGRICTSILVSFLNCHLLHTFAFTVVTFTLSIIILAYFHFNKWCSYVTFTLACVSFKVVHMCKFRFHVFLQSQVSLLSMFTPICVAPLHITRFCSVALLCIKLSYISLEYVPDTFLQLKRVDCS